MGGLQIFRIMCIYPNIKYLPPEFINLLKHSIQREEGVSLKKYIARCRIEIPGGQDRLLEGPNVFMDTFYRCIWMGFETKMYTHGVGHLKKIVKIGRRPKNGFLVYR